MKRTSNLLFLAGLTLLAAGCGSKATVVGTVTYKGKPIPSGYIVFAPESGAPSVDAPITEGKYSAEKVPTGPSKVSITSLYMEPPSRRAGITQRPPQEAMDKMGPPPDAPIPPEARERMERGMSSFGKKGLKIPERYADPAQSGLTYTVVSGAQTKDFNLD